MSEQLVLTVRQAQVMLALKAAPTPATAAQVRDEYDARVLGDGPSDVRGIGQTLRRLRDQLGLVKSSPDGWSFSKAGAAKIRRIAAAA